MKALLREVHAAEEGLEAKGAARNRKEPVAQLHIKESAA